MVEELLKLLERAEDSWLRVVGYSIVEYVVVVVNEIG